MSYNFDDIIDAVKNTDTSDVDEDNCIWVYISKCDSKLDEAVNKLKKYRFLRPTKYTLEAEEILYMTARYEFGASAILNTIDNLTTDECNALNVSKMRWHSIFLKVSAELLRKERRLYTVSAINSAVTIGGLIFEFLSFKKNHTL